jgi:hypothetical protein
VLGINPLEHLLAPTGALTSLPPANQQIITGREFFPHLIAAPFGDGLTVVFIVSAILAAVAACASLMRGNRVQQVAPVDDRPPCDRGSKCGAGVQMDSPSTN